MNIYFASISSVDDSITNLPPFSPKTQNSLHSIHILESEIVDAIQTLKINKASGEDQISNRVLKYTCNTIKNPLCVLFNRSLRECKYRVPWKSALVMALYKKGPKESPSNYRPDSLLSNPGKLMERVIFKHMYNFFHYNDSICKNQSGFLPGHSTVFQLIN